MQGVRLNLLKELLIKEKVDIKKEEELLKKYQEFKEYHIGKMFV